MPRYVSTIMIQPSLIVPSTDNLLNSCHLKKMMSHPLYPPIFPLDLVLDLPSTYLYLLTIACLTLVTWRMETAGFSKCWHLPIKETTQHHIREDCYLPTFQFGSQEKLIVDSPEHNNEPMSSIKRQEIS
jgi:hypothetical protein